MATLLAFALSAAASAAAASEEQVSIALAAAASVAAASEEQTAIESLCVLIPPSVRTQRGVHCEAQACSWPRDIVSCDSGRVRTISLNESYLTGSLPSEVGRLGSLRVLQLHRNSLSGSIPSEIADLASMEDLTLNSNALSGTVPAGLDRLPLLSTITMSSNLISGTIPAEILGGLTSASSMWLNGNSLSGTLPEIGGLTNLATLALLQNSISGTIPPSIGKLSSVLRLWLNSQRISGTIPVQLGKLASMRAIGLGDNALSGTIPAELAANLTNLVGAGLHHNALSGSLPPMIGQLTSMTVLWLQGNSLTGALPRQLGRLTDLTMLWLSDNQLRLPSTASERAAHYASIQACAPHGAASCLGIPPHSCDAFKKAALSITDPSECVQCPDDALTWVLVIVVYALFVVAVLGAFVWITAKAVHSLRSWISSIVILINYAQVNTVVLSLCFKWPPSVQKLLAYFSLNLLHIPFGSCILDTSIENYGIYVFSALIACILMLLIPTVLRFAAQHQGASALVDWCDLVLSILFSLQLGFSWSVAHESIIGLVLWGRGSATLGAWDEGSVSYVPDANEFGGVSWEHRWAGTVLAPALLLFQLVVCLGLFGNILSYQRGAASGVWSTSTPMEVLATCCRYDAARARELTEFAPQVIGSRAAYYWQHLCIGKPLAPQHLEKRVAFLTRRFAPHAPRWQLILWARLVALFVLVTVSNLLAIHVAADSTPQTAGQVGIALTAIAVLCCFWRHHHRTMPYVYRYQNALEWWLYAASVMLLFLSAVWLLIPGSCETRESGTCHLLEYLMFFTLLGGMTLAAAYLLWRLRTDRRILAQTDVFQFLEHADEAIDRPLHDRLLDGTVRLVRCGWLRAESSNAALARDPHGAVILRRRQDLPPEAFVPCDEAYDMLKRGDRSVIALSYGWLTADHPDPHGTTLQAVRRHLAEQDDLEDCGLFWDFASIPQRDERGERSVEDTETFRKALEVMGYFYASITGTCVIVFKDIIVPLGAGPVYNPLPYEGEGGRGWCQFEQGVSTTVAAHLRIAEAEAVKMKRALIPRFSAAQSARHKVIDISGGVSRGREVTEAPDKILKEAMEMIQCARFSDDSDRHDCVRLLATFDWTIQRAITDATTDYASSGKTLTPNLVKKLRSQVRRLHTHRVSDVTRRFDRLVPPATPEEDQQRASSDVELQNATA